MTGEPVAYWNGQAARFDEEPDHGLRDATVRDAWDRLLSKHLPEPPVDVLDLGCGTGSLTRAARRRGSPRPRSRPLAHLLRPGGRLILVEGRWWTRGGLTADKTRRLVRPYASQVRTVALTDPALWGSPVVDERYLCVAVPIL